MNIKKHFSLFITSTAVVIAGCANTAPSSTNVGAITTSTTSTTEVPSLTVAIDCGKCEVKPTIPWLIVEGYNEAATKAGHKISTTKEAHLVIKEYTARSDAARFLVGAMAGKDEIKAIISYQGNTYSVEDYYRNAWLGIDTLAKKIGEMTLAEIK